MSENLSIQREKESLELSFKPFIVFVGCVFIFGGILYSAYNIYQILTFEKILAKVASIGETKNTGKMPATINSIWVSFDLPKQMVYTQAGKTVFYNPYQKGDIVEVYYNPQNPNEAFIHSFNTTWFIPAVFLYLPGFTLLLWTVFRKFRTLKDN